MNYAITTGRPTLAGLGMLPPLDTPFGSVQGTGTGTGTSPVLRTGTRCKPCPDGCRTEKRSETYYARKERISADDIAIPMVRKVIKCEEGANSQPHLPCADEIAALKAKYGLQGLQGLRGCSACSQYAGRM
mgnify:FL=1